MLSQSGQYAVRAMVALANREVAEPLDAARLASLLNLPANYLSKILQILVRTGLLRSVRGVHGGYAIARSLDKITLLSIVAPFEHLSKQDSCLMGRPGCNHDGCCGLHLSWRGVVNTYLAFLQDSTLADLVGDGSGAEPIKQEAPR